MTRLNIVFNDLDEKNIEKAYELLNLDKEVISKADVVRQCISTLAKQDKKNFREKRHIVIPDDIVTHDDIVRYLGIDKLSKAYVSLRDKITKFYG